MNASKLIAATLITLAGSAFAADAPAQAGAAKATVAAGATAAATATATAAKATVASANAANLNLPALDNGAARDRDAVRAEAIEAAKNHKTTLALQLDLIK